MLSTNTKSISFKIDLALIILFLIMLVVSSLYQFKSQRAMVENMVVDQANSLAESYFDNVNTLMLTGKMAQKEIARTKIMSREEVIDARVIRGEEVAKVFGAAKGSSIAQADEDNAALAGEHVEKFTTTENGRVLTLAFPLAASPDYHGTNCMMCHRTDEGNILGAVRLDYSLAKLDADISKQIWTNIGLTTLLLVLGLIVISLILRKIVTRPLNNMIGTLRVIEADSDLTKRVELTSDDEIGEVASTFNQTMEKFSVIIGQVLQSSHHLNQESRNLQDITLKNMEGTQAQHAETEQVATAFTEMEQTSHEVAQNATSAAKASDDTQLQARNGQSKVDEAVASINNLSTNIEKTAESVQQLEEHSADIGKVVDVISGIAEQTNLLALNAAIEAARAGEQGRGFAVVADEVRALATRTHDSTNEIQSMINELQAYTQSAAEVMRTSVELATKSVEHTNETGVLFGEITDAVEQVSMLNTQNASAAEEQQAVATEINRSIVSINTIASSTADACNEVTETLDRLTALSSQLESMVDQFKV